MELNNLYKKYDHDIDDFKDSLFDLKNKYNINDSDLIKFYRLKKASEFISNGSSDYIIKIAKENKDILSKLNTENDVLFFVISMLYDNKKEIKKIAYPNIGNSFFMNNSRYNLQDWASCVHKIYQSSYSGELDYNDAVKKYSSNIFKDENERNNFLNWLKYYNHGEHLKYNVKNASLNKSAAYQMSLSPSGDAYSSTSNYVDSDYSINHDDQENDAKEGAEKKINYKNWKKKFNTALRRVDKILKESEEYIDADKYEEISQVLNKLDVQVGKIRLQTSASDISYRAATQLKKLGFDSGAKVLYKYSQDASPVEQTSVPAQQSSEEQSEQPVEQPGPSQAEIKKKQDDKLDVEKGKELMSNVSPLPGPAEDEYKDVMKENVSVEDASRKLEQIAGTLSDRRVIRYLAEFDIILDKIGIAPMFPELAEAQSKLIESYSYALTRVTKMLGMLSNNKAIMEASSENKIEPAGSETTPENTQEAPTNPEIQQTVEKQI